MLNVIVLKEKISIKTDIEHQSQRQKENNINAILICKLFSDIQTSPDINWTSSYRK